MKKSFIFASLIAMVAMLAVSCQKELPTARFDYSVDGLTVTFQNMSKDADAFAWEFGDGEKSTEKDPVHTYAEAGTYSVKLTAKNKDGEKSVTQDVVLAEGAFSIEIDGDFSDWAKVPADILAEAKVDENATLEECYDIKFCSDADFIYFYIEYNGQEFEVEEGGEVTNNTIGVLDIFMNTDDNAETGHDSWIWTNSGADYLLEGGTDVDAETGAELWWPDAFSSTGTGWDWAEVDGFADGMKLSEIKSFNGHKALEGSIMRVALGNPKSLKVGVLTQGAGWSGEFGALPETYIADDGTSVVPEMLEVKLN